MTPTLCPHCGGHVDRCRCTAHVRALRTIAANTYGIQGIQEDYGHDVNAYNFHAMRYFSGELFRKENVARRALAHPKGDA